MDFRIIWVLKSGNDIFERDFLGFSSLEEVLQAWAEQHDIIEDECVSLSIKLI